MGARREVADLAAMLGDAPSPQDFLLTLSSSFGLFQ